MFGKQRLPLLLLSVGFRDGVTSGGRPPGPGPSRGRPTGPQPPLGPLASPDKLCEGRKGRSGGAAAAGLPESRPFIPTRKPASRNSPGQPVSAATLRSRGDSHAAVAGAARDARGGRDSLRGAGCGRRGRNARLPESEAEGVSAQRGSRPPGTRAARALTRRILAGAGAHRVPRAALRLPSGSRSGRQLSPRHSPGRPLCPRLEPGGRGPSRRPQLQPVFVASSCSTALPRLVAHRFARSWGSLLLGGCTHLQRSGRLAERAPASAGCKERRREGTGPSSSCSEPRCGGRGSRRAAAAEAAAAGGGGSDAARGASAPGPGRAGSPRGRPEGRCTETASSRGQQGRRAPGSHAPVARGGARGLPGPQPRAAWRAPASRPASGPSAARLGPAGGGPGSSPSPAGARSLFAEPPARPPCRCSAPARLTGASARSSRGASLPARPPRSGPIRDRREAVTRVTRRRVLRGAWPRGRHARFSRQNSKAGRVARQPPPQSWGEAGPTSKGLQLPVCSAQAPGGGAPTGGAGHAGTCSPFVGRG